MLWDKWLIIRGKASGMKYLVKTWCSQLSIQLSVCSGHDSWFRDKALNWALGWPAWDSLSLPLCSFPAHVLPHSQDKLKENKTKPIRSRGWKHKIQQRYWSSWEVTSNWRGVCTSLCHRSGSQMEELCGPSSIHLMPGESQRDQMYGLWSGSIHPGQLATEKPAYVVGTCSVTVNWSDNVLKS